MNILKAFFITGILSVAISACSSNSSKYLKIGETAKNGKLSQTIERLDYSPSSQIGLDENQLVFELEYKLHSDYGSITSLSNMGYSAVFDNNKNNGGLYPFGTSITPTSIAPNADERVVLSLYCFKDWKTATISYKDNNNIVYSFSIRSSDYTDHSNNNYPVLKKGGSFVDADGKVRITFKTLKRTDVGSAGVGNDSDNLEFVVGLTSLSNEAFALPASTMGYYLQCDAGFSYSRFNVATPNLPSNLLPNESVDLEMIIIVSKQWNKMVFGYSSNNQKLSYYFTILHSEITY